LNAPIRNAAQTVTGGGAAGYISTNSASRHAELESPSASASPPAGGDVHRDNMEAVAWSVGVDVPYAKQILGRRRVAFGHSIPIPQTSIAGRWRMNAADPWAS
jgi:hypothetical protein